LCLVITSDWPLRATSSMRARQWALNWVAETHRSFTGLSYHSQQTMVIKGRVRAMAKAICE
jgi:hypothetical protein